MILHISILITDTKTKENFIVYFSDKDEKLLEINWYPLRSPRSRQVYVRGKQGNKTVLMHRLVLEEMLQRPLKKGETVDHINGDAMDNRRENLRLATNSENAANRGAQSNSQSGIKGIYPKGKKWGAKIKFHQKNIYLGSYDTKEQAKAAYDAKALELFGRFANKG